MSNFSFKAFAHAKRYSDDKSGMAAVEFGLIVPIMLMMLLGTIEYGRAEMMARRFNLVTSMASDLIAREQSMSDADLKGVENAVKSVWGNYDIATLKLNVYQVRSARATATKKAPGTTYVDWNYPMLGASSSLGKCDNYALPANMVSQGNSTIIVNGTYTFVSLFGSSTPGQSASTKGWTSTSSHAPRNLCVDYNKTNCISDCE